MSLEIGSRLRAPWIAAAAVSLTTGSLTAGCPTDPELPDSGSTAIDASLVGLDAPGLDAPAAPSPDAWLDDAPGLDAPFAPGDDAAMAAGCGDGALAGSEQCDDGNTRAGDGCDPMCMLEPTPSCGDGTTNRPVEECDDGNTMAGDGCGPTCRVEVPAMCGNGALELATGEECDDGNTRSGDGCSASCQIEPSGATCGDSTTDRGERCDDGNPMNGDACNPTCNLTNTTSVFAGAAGMAGRMDGVGSAARFTNAGVLAADDRYLWMAEQPGMGGSPPSVLRRIEIASAAVLTVARAITADGGSIYFCEFNAHTIRQGVLATGAVSTLVGTADTSMGSTGGYAEGVGTAALVASPWGIVYHHPSGSIFFSDASRTIRRIQ